MSQHFQGTGGAPGIVIGRTVRYTTSELALRLDEDDDTALQRFSTAQQTAARQLSALAGQLRTEGRDEEANIIDTQALFVEDITLTDEVCRRVREAHEPLEQALDATIDQIRATFHVLDDAYLRERAADIEAIGRMIHAALRGDHASLLERVRSSTRDESSTPDTIIIASDLTPAETAQLRGGMVAGFATAHGGPTSHTSILARSLGIPAVVGLGDEVLDIPDNTEVILDGSGTRLISTPEAAEYSHYQQHISEQQTLHKRWQSLRTQPGQMADGHRVSLWANIGHPNDAHLALEQGAEGIGLFRTEFLFLNRTTQPDEEEQYLAYRRTLETMAGRTVVIRTLDVGGDKPVSYLDLPVESNPLLGVRGIRLCMRHPELMLTQFRALLRAALHGDLWVMLPMIATPADVAWGCTQLRIAAQQLAAEGIDHRATLPLGIMVETPAAAVTTDLLARSAAFFSIGSNDLTQYTMAADRNMTDLSADYPHTSPAVLRLISQAVRAGREGDIPVEVCGELAGLPDVAPLLVGLGVTALSMAPAAIPAVKERLCSMTLAEAQAVARQALAGEIEERE